MNHRTIIRATKRDILGKLVRIRKLVGIPSKDSKQTFLPRLSVIVPCFNVENYLLDTLNSIKAQDYYDLEVIIVNDGSTDRTGILADQFAAKNRKFRVIHKSNNGLGAARNTGITQATGDFITFIDSDDTIPKKSLTLMVATLRMTGSDFVIGTMQRSDGKKTWTPAWATKLHARDTLNTTLDADFNVLLDVYACNKVFRKSFWDAHLKAFPEGIRYEDQEVTTAAYTRSSSFDILKKVVYTWKIRNDGSSITQQKIRIEDLKDRLTVANRVASILNTDSTQNAFHNWLPQTIGFLFAPYYTEAPRASDSYWLKLQKGVQQLAKSMAPENWRLISFWDRLSSLSAVYGNIEDIKLIQARKQEYKSGYSISTSGSKFIASTDFLSELSFEIPDYLLEINEDSLAVDASILASDWNDSNELVIRFNAQIPGIDSQQYDGQCKAFLVPIDYDSKNPATIPLPIYTASEPSFDAFNYDAYNSYSNSVYETVLSPNKLLTKYGTRLSEFDWRLEIELTIAGITRRTTAGKVSPLGSGATATHGRTENATRLTIQYAKTGSTIFKFHEFELLVDQLGINSEMMLLKLAECGVGMEGRFEIRRSDSKVKTETIALHALGSDGRYALPDTSMPINLPSVIWDIVYKTRTSISEVSYSGSSTELRQHSPYGSPFRLRLSGTGTLQLIYAPVGVHVDQVSVSPLGNTLTLEGFATLPDGHTMAMQFENRNFTIPVSLVWSPNSGTFTASVELDRPGLYGQNTAHSTGGYPLTINVVNPDGDTETMWVPVTLQLMSRLPIHHINDLSRVRLARTKGARALWLDIYPRLHDEERGPLAERLLHKSIQKLNKSEDLLNATLFESYGGLSVSDSPMDLFKYAQANGLGGDLYWAIRDASVAVPDGCTPLIIGSREYVRILHSAKNLVNNNNFPHYFRKTPGQYYLQTWHGTPLKKIGNDVPRTSLSQSYRALMARESEYWNCLLSQNSYATPVLAAAFDYSGRILETGYPRNDTLLTPMTPQENTESRENLGIPDHSKIVLYAPTWRDNVRTASNHYDLATFMDFEKIHRDFGDEVQILLRGHSNTSQAARKTLPKNVIDVSRHHNINELMRLSDLLITDYSSIMFDYSCTAKPIIIHAPDYEEYSGDIRGFYFDLRKNPPGPISYDNEELSHQIDSYLFQNTTVTNSFASIFTPNDDGSATSRVAHDLWIANSQSLES